MFETNFINEILNNLTLSCPIHIINQNPVEELIEKKFEQKSIVILLGDESKRPNKLKNCLVFRQYKHSKFPAENERAIPLPIRAGYSPPYHELSTRNYLFSFSGQKNPSRDIMVNVINNYTQRNNVPFYLNITDSFSAGLSIEEYAEIMSQTVFALIPWGGHYETFRYTEALYSGCIPVTLFRPTEWYDSKCTIYLRGWYELPRVLKLNPQKFEEWSKFNVNHYREKMSPVAVARYIEREWKNFLNTSSNTAANTK